MPIEEFENELRERDVMMGEHLLTMLKEAQDALSTLFSEWYRKPDQKLAQQEQSEIVQLTCAALISSALCNVAKAIENSDL